MTMSTSARIWFTTAAAISVAWSGTIPASELSDAADSLQPGEWMVFSTQGYTRSLLDACDGIHSILEWSNKAVWNPLRKEVHYVGQGHYSCAKYIVYKESTNQWQIQPSLPPGIKEIGHAYEHNAIDPRNGELYYRHYYAERIDKFNPVTNTWSTLPPLGLSSIQVSGGIAYIPEANGLLFVDGQWGVHFYSSTSNSWTLLANTDIELDSSKPRFEMGPYNNFASYNPVHKLVYFGGGGNSTSFYSMDANLNLRRLTNSPTTIAVANAMTLADPSSGAQLIFADDGSVYEYDRQGNQWFGAGTHSIMSHATSWRISVPIPDYGVTMFTTWNFDNSTVLLYRHAPGNTSDPIVPPRAPANLQAN